MTKSFDFTTSRVGSRVGPYRRKIITCKKCGRKGTDDGTVSLQTGKYQMVTHVGEIIVTPAIACFSVRDHCMFPV